MEEKKLKRMLKRLMTKYKADFDSLAKGLTPEEYEKLKREEQLKKDIKGLIKKRGKAYQAMEDYDKRRE